MGKEISARLMTILPRPCDTRSVASPAWRKISTPISTKIRSTSSQPTTTPTSQPTVLPTRIPNLLVNGSNGIAVGMATNIPPHNLTEIVEATILLVNNPAAQLPEILNIVKGPDFPTYGIIHGKAGIYEAYKTGRGRFMMRAKAGIETFNKDRQAIVVTEIPVSSKQKAPDRTHGATSKRQDHRRHK